MTAMYLCAAEEMNKMEDNKPDSTSGLEYIAKKEPALIKAGEDLKAAISGLERSYEKGNELLAKGARFGYMTIPEAIDTFRHEKTYAVLEADESEDGSFEWAAAKIVAYDKKKEYLLREREKDRRFKCMKLLSLETGLERDDTFYGLAFGGINMREKNFTGLQFGANNVVYQRMRGVQAGFSNEAEDVAGARIGVFNVARKAKGLDIGCVNFTHDGDNTLQLGGVCIILSNPWYARFLPGVNYGRSKKKEEE